MQIVINIPEEKYNQILNFYQESKVRPKDYEIAIMEGIPLPKGHGDLIDRDEIWFLKPIHDAKYGHISWSDAIKKIKYSAPTIIEADKESEE